MKAFQRILAALLKMGTKPARARAMARKLSAKLNKKAPRGRPGGGPLRQQDKEASRAIRKDPGVIARKKQAKQIKRDQAKQRGAAKRSKQQANAKERREFYKEEVVGREDFAAQELLPDFKKGKVSDAEIRQHTATTKAMRKKLGRLTKKQRAAAACQKAARQMKLPLKKKDKK